MGVKFLNGSSLTEARMQLIQVLYRKDRRGSVDDVTLDELIRSQKISHFYRPAEKRWVDIFVDPVRGSGQTRGAGGLKRRDTDWEEHSQPKAREQKSGGRLRGVFMRFKKHPPRTIQRAEEWFERGFFTLRATDDYGEAARAFALSIRLNPQYQKAYLHRGRAYEALGNLQQAIEDYSRAIVLDPKDGKAHYLRGLAFGHLGMAAEAIADLRRAANLQYGPACKVLASRTELQEALPTERRCQGQASDAGVEGFPEVPEDLQRPTERYGKEITQFDAQGEGVKHEHDILLEASRLLEEEVVTPHRTLYENLLSASEEKE
jgi:tetratricopeptide (TPR) repeat protein